MRPRPRRRWSCPSHTGSSHCPRSPGTPTPSRLDQPRAPPPPTEGTIGGWPPPVHPAATHRPRPGGGGNRHPGHHKDALTPVGALTPCLRSNGSTGTSLPEAGAPTSRRRPWSPTPETGEGDGRLRCPTTASPPPSCSPRIRMPARAVPRRHRRKPSAPSETASGQINPSTGKPLLPRGGSAHHPRTRSRRGHRRLPGPISSSACSRPAPARGASPGRRLCRPDDKQTLRETP